MRLNTDFKLAYKLLRLHTPNTFLNVKDAAFFLGTQVNYLHHIVLKLKKAGLLKVKRGPKGGISETNADATSLDIAFALGYFPPIKQEPPEILGLILLESKIKAAFSSTGVF